MDLTKNLKVECVSRLQPPAPIVLSPEDSVRQAIGLMQEHGQGGVLICEDGAITGIFTERDLLIRVVGAGKPLTVRLKECMSPNPVLVRQNESVGTALRKMQEGGYRNLPVVDESESPVGMLSVKRIVHYLAEHFPGIVYNQPPDPDAVQDSREGA